MALIIVFTYIIGYKSCLKFFYSYFIIPQDTFLLTALIIHFSDLFSHTKGHISYYVTGREDEHPAVFTGDTLVS